MILHASLIGPHLGEAVEGRCVRHGAIRQGTHRMHSCAHCIERHAGSDSHGDSSTSRPESVDPRWTKEEVGVLLAPIVDVCHRCTNRTDSEAISNRATHEHTLISCTEQTIQDAAIIATVCLRVQLVDLHTSEHQVDWVSDDTSTEPPR